MLEDPEQIWERVRAMKEEQGKSLGQIAKDSGVPLTTVKRFFNGATKNPGFLSLCQIIYALGASVDEVLGAWHREGFLLFLLRVLGE